MLTGDDARRYFDERHVAVPADEVRAITAYSIDSRPVNMPLRGLSTSSSGSPPTQRELLHALEEEALITDAIERQMPLDRIVVTWRAIGPNRLYQYLHSAEAADPAFQSSSTNREHVENTYLQSSEHRLRESRYRSGHRYSICPASGTVVH